MVAEQLDPQESGRVIKQEREAERNREHRPGERDIEPRFGLLHGGSERMEPGPYHFETEDDDESEAKQYDGLSPARRHGGQEELESHVCAVAQSDAGAQEEEPDQKEPRRRVDEVDREAKDVARDHLERDHEREHHADPEQSGFGSPYEQAIGASPRGRQRARLQGDPARTRVVD